MLHFDIDMDGEVTVVDASQIAAAVGLPPGTLACLAPGDCSSFQGVGPGLGPDNLDPGSVEVLGEFQYGNAEVDEDGNVVYTASPDGRSPDTVVFQVCDLEGLCNRGTINIKVVADANQPPTTPPPPPAAGR